MYWGYEIQLILVIPPIIQLLYQRFIYTLLNLDPCWSLMELREEMKESYYQVHVSHGGFNADPVSTTVFGWMMCRARVLTALIQMKIAWGRRLNGYGWSSFLFLSIDGSAEAEHVFINFFHRALKHHITYMRKKILNKNILSQISFYEVLWQVFRDARLNNFVIHSSDPKHMRDLIGVRYMLAEQAYF